MKIRSLYIENFGGLCRHEMSFEDGLNVLCLPNGWGKSTLSVFIKAMLYGLPVSTKRSLIENERKRYTPWQGGVFGGSMVIEIDGTSYRIERTFGAKESEDTLSVCDAITGEEIGGFSGELSPGEQLLGVDAAAYERSTYLSQRQLQGDDGELSIHAKLNRLVDATDDLASYDAAMEILEKQRKYYTVSGGRRGAIADTEAGIYALKEQIDQARHAAAQAEGLSSRIVALETQLLQNEKEQRALHDSETEYHRKGETVAKQRHYQALRTALTQKQTQLAAMLHGVGGESPTDEQIDALKQAQHRAQEHRHTLASLELEASALMPTEEQSAYKSVPDERALEELRMAAEEAQRTQMLCLSLREGAEPTQEREEPLPTADELARMRGVCLRYGTERAENVELAKEQTWTIKSLQATAARAKKYACLLGAVAVLLWLCTAGSLLPEQTQGGFWLMAQIGTLVFGALLLAGAVWLGKKSRKASAEIPAARELLTQGQEKIAQLDEAWRELLVELRAYGEASDVSQVWELIAALEQRQAQDALSQQENAQKAARFAAAREQAAQAYAALCALWREYGEPPTAADAPVALERLRAACEDRASKQARLQTVREQIAAQTTVLQAAQESIREQCSRYPDLPEESVAPVWLMQQRQGIAALREEIAEQTQALEQFAAQQGLEGAVTEIAEPTLPVRNFAAERQELERAHDAQGQQLALLRQQQEQLLEAAAQLDMLEPQLYEAEATLVRQREALEAVELTKTHMEKAKKQLSERYLVQMKRSFSDYYAVLTQNDALSFTMDGSFRIKLRAAGVQRSTESFSVGQRDMISLCARLSLVDALFENEAPFLILDDPFVNLDDVTVARAGELLRTAAQKYQILYLTCHSSRENV